MATTFKDFVVECELYPHSREYFEFMKECSELELTEKFIENQIFMSEARLAIANVDIEENYLQESVDNIELEMLTEKYNTKSNGLLMKLIKAIQKIFGVFTKFFAKLGNMTDPITSKGQSVLSILNSSTLDDEQITRIKDIVDKAKSNQASAFPIKANQPYLKHIKLKYAGSAEYLNELRNDLAVALSNKTVVADASITNDKGEINITTIGIMDPDDIYAAGIALAMGK